MSDESNSVFIGEGVYVDIENGALKLFTGGAKNPLNTIYLGPETFSKLIKLLESVGGGHADS